MIRRKAYITVLALTAAVAAAAVLTGCSQAKAAESSADISAETGNAEADDETKESVVVILETAADDSGASNESRNDTAADGAVVDGSVDVSKGSYGGYGGDPGFGPESSDGIDAAGSAGAAAGETDMDDYFSSDPVMKYGTVLSVDGNDSIEISCINSDIDENGAVDSSATEDSIIFFAADGVPVIDASTGETIELKDVSRGSFVYAWGGDTMTMSLPPQMSLQALVTNIPADAAAPLYGVVKSRIVEESGSSTYKFSLNDGEIWTAIEGKTQVVPFRTRQIVKLQDIRNGSRVIVWGARGKDAGEGELSKIMLMNP